MLVGVAPSPLMRNFYLSPAFRERKVLTPVTLHFSDSFSDSCFGRRARVPLTKQALSLQDSGIRCFKTCYSWFFLPDPESHPIPSYTSDSLKLVSGTPSQLESNFISFINPNQNTILLSFNWLKQWHQPLRIIFIAPCYKNAHTDFFSPIATTIINAAPGPVNIALNSCIFSISQLFCF